MAIDQRPQTSANGRGTPLEGEERKGETACPEPLPKDDTRDESDYCGRVRGLANTLPGKRAVAGERMGAVRARCQVRCGDIRGRSLHQLGPKQRRSSAHNVSKDRRLGETIAAVCKAFDAEDSVRDVAAFSVSLQQNDFYDALPLGD